MFAENFGTRERLKTVRIGIMLIVGILFARLIQLQLIYHQEFGKKSEENAIRMVVKEPIRGYVFDRNGKLVVDVGPAYNITVTPAEFRDESLPLLSSLVNVPVPSLQSLIQRGKQFSRFSQVRIVRDVDFTTLSSIEEHRALLPGVSVQVESKREYRNSFNASHLLGYVKEITDQQLKRSGDYYQQGDMIGSSGIEASYELFLRGQKGFEFISVNAYGQIIGKLHDGNDDIPPREGFDLILSMDAGIQALAESLMTAGNHRGAIVALDPEDGGIIALVSKPDYSPSMFSGYTRREDWLALANDTVKPLFNRATLTRYPPGSTFKMVLAAAALEQGIIDEHTVFNCPGIFYLGRHPYRDLHVHGNVNVVEAIKKSCNVFFYKLMLKTDFNSWSEMGDRFGFGKPTGIDIGEETAGLLPSPQVYDRLYGPGRWTQGYTISLAIGQGELGVSPLQMAVYAAALANGGTLHQPHAVRAVYNKVTRKAEMIQHANRPLNISAQTMQLIREGLRQVVQEPGGTGGTARIPGIESAGKTGTAQNPHGEDHAWYIGFAPFEKPTIAVVVMLENAGFGGSKAAPLAKQIIQRYVAQPAPQMQIAASPVDSGRVAEAPKQRSTALR